MIKAIVGKSIPGPVTTFEALSQSGRSSHSVGSLALLRGRQSDRALVLHAARMKIRRASGNTDEVITDNGVTAAQLSSQVRVNGVPVRGEPKRKMGKEQKHQRKGCNPAGRAKSRKRPSVGVCIIQPARQNTEPNGYLFPKMKLAHTVKSVNSGRTHGVRQIRRSH